MEIEFFFKCRQINLIEFPQTFVQLPSRAIHVFSLKMKKPNRRMNDPLQ